MADKRGIGPRAFKRMASADPFGCPVFCLYYNSTSTSGTTATEVIVENAPFKFRVLRAWFTCAEAPTATDDSAKLTDGTNDITDTADYSSLSDADSMEWTKYDDAYASIAKDGDLKLVKTESANVSKIDVFVLCARVA